MLVHISALDPLWQVQTIGAARARDWTGVLILWLLDWFAWTLHAWTYFHAALPEEELVKRLGPKGSWVRRLRAFLAWGKDRPVHGMDLAELRAYQFLVEGQVQTAMYIAVLLCYPDRNVDAGRGDPPQRAAL